MKNPFVIFFVLLLFLAACAINANVVKEYAKQTDVYFCPRDSCKDILIAYLNSSEKISCALYDLNIQEAGDILKSKNARVLMEDKNSRKTALNSVDDSKYSVMHNKFCILDNETVLTGSMNPTIRDTTMNNNNLLIIYSKKIAKTFNDEFEELYSGTSSGGKRTIDNVFYVNNDKISVYFCPEDWCANKILYRLDEAEESIYFMAFSFTHSKIADMLIKKQKQGLIVKGIMEKSQAGERSVFEKLNMSNTDVIKDKNNANMHHKVFIIDRSAVITGSMNPTINGDANNDENLLIIESKWLAEKYIEEFNLLRN